MSGEGSVYKRKFVTLGWERLRMGEEVFLQQCEGEYVLEMNFRGDESRLQMLYHRTGMF